MPRKFYSRHYGHINFALVIRDRKGQKAIDALCDTIDAIHNVSGNKAQRRAFALILLNFVYSNYNPLIISLSNNSYKKIERYNKAGVGSKAFIEVYRKLRRKNLIFLEFEGMRGAWHYESTVIRPADALRNFIIPFYARIVRYVRDEKELIQLRKTIKGRPIWDASENALKADKRRILCLYKDSAYSNGARKFLKRYNEFLRTANLTWGVFPRHHFEELYQQEGLTREEIRRNFDTFLNERDLYRVYTAPSNHNPNNAGRLPRRGGRFYGGFWIEAIPGIARPHLLINDEPVVEIDVRAMNVTMLYFLATRESWHIYPYDSVPLPNRPETYFPKDIIKPFFTWCLNVSSRNSAIQTLKHKLPKELERKESRYFLRDNRIRYKEVVDAALEAHSDIEDYFFNTEPVGMDLQFHDSEIAARILGQCLEEGICSLPVHDAFIVPRSRETRMKQIIVRTICSYFKANFQDAYLEERNPRCLTKSTYPT